MREGALAKGIVSQAGMAAYQRAADGKLASIRICDNAGYTGEIDHAIGVAGEYVRGVGLS